MIFLLASIFIDSELSQLGARRYVKQTVLAMFCCVAAAQRLQQQRVRPHFYALYIAATIM
jgi:hypothetical protein